MHYAVEPLSTAIPAEMTGFARAVLSASAAVFFWIEEDYRVLEYESIGPVAPDWVSDYQSGWDRYDPLNPQLLLKQRRDFGLYSVERHNHTPSNVARYGCFRERYSVADEAVMLFWQGDRPLAGLGLLRLGAREPFSQTDHDWDAMSRYFSHSLGLHPRAQHRRLDAALEQRFGLTLREREVVSLVSQGASNADLAVLMQIGVSTVKTYMFSIMNKLGLDSRAAIIAFCRTL